MHKFGETDQFKIIGDTVFINLSLSMAALVSSHRVPVVPVRWRQVAVRVEVTSGTYFHSLPAAALNWKNRPSRQKDPLWPSLGIKIAAHCPPPPPSLPALTNWRCKFLQDASRCSVRKNGLVRSCKWPRCSVLAPKGKITLLLLIYSPSASVDSLTLF